MKTVSGTRCIRPIFISLAGIVRMSPSIHERLSFAFSPGRSIEQVEKRKRIRIRTGADFITCMMFGSSCHSGAGMGVTTGAAKTRLKRSQGL